MAYIFNKVLYWLSEIWKDDQLEFVYSVSELFQVQFLEYRLVFVVLRENTGQVQIRTPEYEEQREQQQRD